MSLFLPWPGGLHQYRAQVSELLPNLDALVAHLSGETSGVQDARALAEAARDATTDDALDAVLADVVATWRRD